MWLPVIVAIIPSIFLFALFIMTRKSLTDLEIRQQTLIEERDRREKELALLEAEQAVLKKQITSFHQALATLKKGVDHQQGHSQEERTALRKNMEALFHKMENLQPGGSSDSAKELLDSPLVTEVLALLEQGVTPQEIARNKGMQVGEITLIKSLKTFSPKARS